MAEPIFGLTTGAARLLGDMADDFRERLPDVGRRTRRILTNGDSGELVAAKTIECLGNNVYIFHRTYAVCENLSSTYGAYGCYDLTYGSGGTYSNECDQCGNVDSKGILHPAPGPDAGTEIDTTPLYGLSLRTIPLKMEGMAVLADLGDTVVDAAGVEHALYRVIEATWANVVVYKERWTCCSGVMTLVGKTPILLEGVECSETIVDACVIAPPTVAAAMAWNSQPLEMLPPETPQQQDNFAAPVMDV